jgi:hypothetical protein
MPNQHQEEKNVAQAPVLLCIGLANLGYETWRNLLPVYKAIHCEPRTHGVKQIAINARAEAIAVSCNSWADVEYVRGLRNDGVSIPVLFVASEEMSNSIPPELKCATIVMTSHNKEALPGAFEVAMTTACNYVKPAAE